MSNTNDYQIEYGIIVDCSGKGGNATTPDVVMSIGEYTLCGSKSLTRVLIPSSLKNIGP